MSKVFSVIGLFASLFLTERVYKVGDLINFIITLGQKMGEIKNTDAATFQLLYYAALALCILAAVAFILALVEKLPNGLRCFLIIALAGAAVFVLSNMPHKDSPVSGVYVDIAIALGIAVFCMFFLKTSNTQVKNSE